MPGLLQPTWYLEFIAEMKALGCKFITSPNLFGDDEIQVPLDKQEEAKAIIAKYSVKAGK